jgi:outer membrane murein-binding lipoprotein Lpp
LQRNLLPASILALLLPAGCGRPSAVNTQLRKQIQAMQEQITQLTLERDGLREQLHTIDEQRAPVERLAQSRLDNLFVVSGLEVNRLTLGVDLDPNQPGDEIFKVTFTPIDQYGQLIKAAGSVEIVLREGDRVIGHWKIPTTELRTKWISTVLLYAYVVELTWQEKPTSSKLHVNIAFIDELTGRRFEAERDLEVVPPKP